MFVRLRKNASGTTSVVVVSKNKGVYKEVKHFGTARLEKDIEKLKNQANEWINQSSIEPKKNLTDSEKREYEKAIRVVNNIEDVLLNGVQLLLSSIYDDIGFGQIPNNVLRLIVMAQASQPASKRAIVDHIKLYFDEDVDLNKIYRCMDKLSAGLIYDIQKTCATTNSLQAGVCLILYDVTELFNNTLPSSEEKELDTSSSQVVIGLLVSDDGNLLSYSLCDICLEEDNAIISLINQFKQRFSLDTNFVVIVAPMLVNKQSVELLRQSGYDYVIKADLKTEEDKVRQWILNCPKSNNDVYDYKYANDNRLIMSYSEDKAKKDAHNRMRGIARLRKKVKGDKQATKYDKFLSIPNDIAISVNEDKIEEDSKFDGLRGYITNSSIPASLIVDVYTKFMTTKFPFAIEDIVTESSPIFHFSRRRKEAHLCICFMAYKIYEELERRIKLKGMELSTAKVLGIAKTIVTLKISLQYGKAPENYYTKTLFLTEDQKKIRPLFED